MPVRALWNFPGGGIDCDHSHFQRAQSGNHRPPCALYTQLPLVKGLRGSCSFGKKLWQGAGELGVGDELGSGGELRVGGPALPWEDAPLVLHSFYAAAFSGNKRGWIPGGGRTWSVAGGFSLYCEAFPCF